MFHECYHTLRCEPSNQHSCASAHRPHEPSPGGTSRLPRYAFFRLTKTGEPLGLSTFRQRTQLTLQQLNSLTSFGKPGKTIEKLLTLAHEIAFSACFQDSQKIPVNPVNDAHSSPAKTRAQDLISSFTYNDIMGS